MTRAAIIAIAALLTCACSREPAAPRTPAPPPAPSTEKPILPAPPPKPAARSFADFRPSLHGFHFPNAFSGSPLPISLGGLEKHLNLPNRYGLCGGMSFAAADYFLAKLDPPSVAEPPGKGDALYTYLYSRQVDSLGESFAAVPTFSRWMNLADDAPFGPAFLTLGGLDAILKRLESGQPTLLGLVLTSTAKGGMLWENHQVLAYAVETNTGGRPTLIRIYDPNYPLNDAAALKLTPQSLGRVPAPTGGTMAIGVRLIPIPSVRVVRVAPGRRDTPVRGFFRMEYEPRTPPRP